MTVVMTKTREQSGKNTRGPLTMAYKIGGPWKMSLNSKHDYITTAADA